MKRFFYTLFAVLAFITCSESDVDVSPLIRIEETENSLMLEPFMASKTVSFYTNRDWIATTDAEWLKVYPTSGTAGEVEIRIAADENKTYESRTSSVKISIEGAVQEFSITQMQRDAIIVAQSEYEVSVDGGALDFEVQANVDLTVTISEDAKSWITQVDTRGLETKTLHFDIAECSTKEDREGMITIAGGKDKQTITIRQIVPINIPDLVFKQYILDNYDSNNDGEISASEAYNITNIEVYSDYIESLEGIEYFYNLESLIVSPKHDNAIGMGVGDIWGTTPDTGQWRDSGYYLNGERVSGGITKIDLSNNLKLRNLDCSGNLLENIDLSNNSKLEIIEASYNLDLKSVKFPEQPIIHSLYLSSTSIDKIDLSNLSELENLFIDRGLGLKHIDVSKNHKLRRVDLSGNHFKHIDLSNNTLLEYILCGLGDTEYINISNNPNLGGLDFGHSKVKSIDLTGSPNLTDLSFLNANISSIDVSMLKDLRAIRYGNYQKALDGVFNTIKYIDLSNNTKLEVLDAALLDLEEIDTSNSPALKNLHVELNLLNVLDISYNKDIEGISTYNNPYLSTIYVTPEQQFVYSIDPHTNFAYKGEDVTLYESTDYSKDGEVKQLQEATKGDGIDIVLMGDAYSDRLIADGTYDQTMQTAMEKFFEVEPYKSFRDHFNVYSVTAVSKNEVYNLVSSTALAGYFGGGTLVGGNDQRAFYYAQQAIGEERMDEALIVVMMNSTAYAGTCYMYNPTIGDYGDGVSVSYFPVGEDTESLGRLIHHEAAGHGFSKLGDEYAYQNMGAIPESEIASARTMAEYGWWKNIDFTNDPTKVKWNHFLTDSRYTNDGLGVYEGAFTYWTGAYRPTQNSIMNTNVGGFNAPSRESIYYRIHKLAYGEDWEYDYEEFVEWDAKNRITTRGIPYRLDIPDNFQPTHPPVVVKSSWRSAKNNAPKKAATNNGGNAGGNLRPATSNRTNQQTMSISPNRTVSSSGMVVTIDPATGRKAIERMEIK